MKTFFLSIIAALAFNESEIKTIYHSLEPKSLVQALAYYELYPESAHAPSALDRAKKLLGIQELDKTISLSKLINRMKGQEQLTENELDFIENLAKNLPNRKLKGYNALSEKEVLELPCEEIDLGKALLLSQLEGQKDALYQARCYSAILDLMAIQILSQLTSNDPLEKIEKTNQLIFDQMHFRFPPQSIYADEIDRFTFLPSVMDNHLGVCLGVTALYLAVAQRIDLPLEIITPPGHIYVRYPAHEEKEVNIETTARGIHVPSETYLSVATRSLQKRNLKEVIGMTHVNQASTYLQSEQFEKAAHSYEKALPYMPKDPMVLELLAYSYLLTGKKEEGEKLLLSVKDISADEGFRHKMSEDYLEKKIDLEGIKAVFMRVDDTRASIVLKIERLEKVLTHHPEFRDGLEQLGVSWIQLNRAKEALAALKKYHEIDPKNATIEYYLAILHLERADFKNSWKYYKNAEGLTKEKDYFPKVLKDLRHELMLASPSEES